ncbi:MAG TPA: methionyl-tRNA formyltransferase, partial [Bryobacteraceae bacterium]|nr:methionyl-tRNA formyltransferase [Bryobacteraceae bacterium]
RIRRPEVVAQLAELRADLMIVTGYGQIIPQAIIDLPPLGIVNVHGSLLPKYRGAAPIQWAIANGETVTGVTTMLINAGLDTGDMLLKYSTPIGPHENAMELSERLSAAGADLLLETVNGLASGTLVPEPQDHNAATLAPVLTKEDGLIDWNWTARQICDRSRGFLPWPGTYTHFRGSLLHIWRAKPANDIDSALSGSVLVRGRRLFAACGSGTILEIEEVQLEGRKRMSAEAFVNGQRLTGNDILGEKTN